MRRSLAAALAACFALPSFAASVSLDLPPGADGADLRLISNDGVVVERAVEGRDRVSVELGDVAPGVYRYELRPRLVVPAAMRTAAHSARAEGRTPPGWPKALDTATGMLIVQRDAVQLFDATAASRTDDGPKRESARAKDQVIPDDLIVQSALCTGFKCVNNENFGVDTIRLKEDNVRIHFDDASATAGYAANDWRLVANDQPVSGANYFALEDATAARQVFKVEAAAPANALYVDSTGNIGLQNGAPGLDLHMTTSDTPAIRLEQTNAGGFTAQTWDIGANEANFFIRDLTGGSRLSFRIRPGAPTSSVDINADGQVGIGTDNAAAALDIRRPVADTEALLRAHVRVPGDDPATPALETSYTIDRLKLDASGDLYVGGTISQLSSRRTKENFVEVDGADVLAKLDALPILTWNYKAQPDGDRHLGPTAEDFHEAFGLGESGTQLAPADVAGVALAAARALKAEVDAKDAKIADLEARLARLEAMLATPVATR